jgi:hypothetical protein
MCCCRFAQFRAGADRGAGARQDRGLQAQGHLGRRPAPARLICDRYVLAERRRATRSPRSKRLPVWLIDSYAQVGIAPAPQAALLVREIVRPNRDASTLPVRRSSEAAYLAAIEFEARHRPDPHGQRPICGETLCCRKIRPGFAEETMLEAGRRVYSELKNLCVWNKTNAGMGGVAKRGAEKPLVIGLQRDHPLQACRERPGGTGSCWRLSFRVLIGDRRRYRSDRVRDGGNRDDVGFIRVTQCNEQTTQDLKKAIHRSLHPGRRQAQELYHRPAQQSGRIARSGDLDLRRIPGEGRDRVDSRPHRRGNLGECPEVHIASIAEVLGMAAIEGRVTGPSCDIGPTMRVVQNRGTS